MNFLDILLLAFLGVGVFFAIRFIHRQKKNGCIGCSGNCSSCRYKKEEQQEEKQ